MAAVVGKRARGSLEGAYRGAAVAHNFCPNRCNWRGHTRRRGFWKEESDGEQDGREQSRIETSGTRELQGNDEKRKYFGSSGLPWAWIHPRTKRVRGLSSPLG